MRQPDSQTETELLSRGELADEEEKMQIEERVLTLMRELDAMEGEGMEGVRTSRRVQAAWHRAFEALYGHRNDGRSTAPCSASAMEGLRAKVEKEHPQLYAQFSQKAAAAVRTIQKDVRARSDAAVAAGQLYGPHTGDSERFETVGIDGLAEGGKKAETFVTRTDRGSDHFHTIFNRQLAEKLPALSDEGLRKILGYRLSWAHAAGIWLDVDNSFAILRRLKDWSGLMDFSHPNSGTPIRASALIENAPLRFTEFLRDHATVEDLAGMADGILKELAKNEAVDETTVWQTVTRLENWGGKNVQEVLADRFPKSMVAASKASPDVRIASDDAKVALATACPAEYLELARARIKADGVDLINTVDEKHWEYSSSSCGSRACESKGTLSALMAAGLGMQALEAVFEAGPEKLSDMGNGPLMALANAFPKEFAEGIANWSPEETAACLPEGALSALAEKRPDALVNKIGSCAGLAKMLGNSERARHLLQRMVIGGAGEQVLHILENDDYEDLNFHLHAALRKHVPELHEQACVRKGFDYERSVRLLTERWKSPLDEVTNYLVHYAFSESAYHSHRWITPRELRKTLGDKKQRAIDKTREKHRERTERELARLCAEDPCGLVWSK